VPIILRGQAAVDRTSAREGRTSIEETYDPFWSNARRFLDFLTEGDYLIDDIQKARMGNIVKVSGALIFVDLMFLRRMTQVSTLRDVLLERDVQSVLLKMDKDSLT